MSAYHSTTEWRKFAKRFVELAEPYCAWSGCPFPGRYVDKSISGRHRAGPTVNHKVSPLLGGGIFDLANCELMHRHCNVKVGLNLSGAHGVETTQTPRPSRNWFPEGIVRCDKCGEPRREADSVRWCCGMAPCRTCGTETKVSRPCVCGDTNPGDTNPWRY